MASLYWALTTMSTIGFGDIKARTNSERVVSIAIMLVGSIIFGVVIGTYSSIYVAAPVILLWGVKRGEDEAEPLPVRS